MNREGMLHWAELIDSFRIFPRLFLLGCFYWTVVVTHRLLDWYMSMPRDERGLEASGFASVVFVAVLGFLKLVYQTYSDAGRSWGPPATTSTVTATTTTTQ